jgi:hypothetical protein
VTNSDPYVAVSTVPCFLEYQSIGILFSKCRHPVTDLPVIMQWYRLASTYEDIVKKVPIGVGASDGTASVVSPYSEKDQFYSGSGMEV